MDIMRKHGVEGGFTNEAYNELFDSIDDDGSGVLGKDEVTILLK